MLVCIPNSKPLIEELNQDNPAKNHNHNGYVLTCQRAVSAVGCHPLSTWGARACCLDKPGLEAFLLTNQEDLLMPTSPDFGCVLMSQCPVSMCKL